jgi:hypothetical protein
MTDKPTAYLPTARVALAQAYALVSIPEADEIDLRRAEVLLGIARELRQEAQYRAIDRRRLTGNLAAAGIPVSDPALAKLESYRKRFRETAPEETVADMAFPDARAAKSELFIEDWQNAKVSADEGAAVGRAIACALSTEATQHVAKVVEWAVGDRAECVNCHTPIELLGGEPIGDREGLKYWQHKYTGQAACAFASMSSEQGGEPTHTFAAPAGRKA